MGLSRAQSPRIGFRFDIQALRAVAVTGVVVYHLWPHALPGGFVGVDVFFVISGFLITQLLAEEAGRTGRVGLTQFWARRIRRILPAALTVLAACVVLVVAFMPRLVWPDNLSQIRASALYVENWLLGAHAVNYLSAENSPSVVQHYWTLSVEEQFYLVWPLLVLLALALAARVRRVPRRAVLLSTLVVATLASFVASVAWTAADPAMAFYATPVRAWEFGVGGIVGLVALWSPRRHAGAARIGLGWLGLGSVFASYAVINGSDQFPGWIATMPVLGAAAFIAGGIDVTGRSTAGLRAWPVQWAGDNSYSIYLWHWPLIIVTPWLTHHPNGGGEKVGIVAITLALAAITKRLIEDPIRLGDRWRRRRSPSYAFAALGMVALVVASSIVNRAPQVSHTTAAARARAQTQVLLATHNRSCFGAAAMLPVNDCASPYARPRHLDLGFAAADGRSDPCLEHFDAAAPQYCVLGRTTSTTTIALVGNSHAWRLIPALDLYSKRHGWKLVVATRINCLGLITSRVADSAPSANCLNWSRDVQQHLLSMPHLRAVIFPSYRYARDYLAGLHPSNTQTAAASAEVLATWRKFAARHIRVVVTGDVPGMRPDNGPDCIARSSARTDPCAVARSSVVLPNLVADLAQQNPGLASYIPMTQYFCDATKCHGLIGGVVVYFDSHHITTTFARSLARYFGASVAAAIAQPLLAGAA